MQPSHPLFLQQARLVERLEIPNASDQIRDASSTI